MDNHRHQDLPIRHIQHQFQTDGPRHRRKKNPLVQSIKIAFFAVVLTVALIFLWSFFTATSSVFHFVLSQAAPLGQPLKSTDDRVNVLLLGIGGGAHEGADLTDSIIITSYNLKTNKSYLISVPRDL